MSGPQLYIAKSGARQAPTLPLESVTRTFAIVGQRGTGKTNTATVMVEEMARKGGHVAVLDPVGVWYGVTRAGEKPGIPGIVIGGEHGDVPLEETAGGLVAELVVGRHWPVVVIDMKLLRKGAQQRFMADYLETLFHSNREPLMQVFEEADRALPQQTRSQEVAAARTLGAGEDIVKLGRSRGLGALLVTQRPATLNKNALEVCESLILHALMGPNDRKAAKAWIDANGDERKAKVVLDSLAHLKLGECWLWAPWLDLLDRLRIRERKTFDSSFTPTVGQKVAEPTQRAPVNLDELRDRMAETVKRHEENDPRRLRKQIAELEGRVEELSADRETVEVEVEREVRVVVPDTQAIARLNEAAAQLSALHEGFRERHSDAADLLDRVDGAMQETGNLADALSDEVDKLTQLPREGRRVGEPPGGMDAVPPTKPSGGPVAPRRAIDRMQTEARGIEARRAAGNGGAPPRATNAKQRILDALAWLDTVGLHPASRLQLAMVCGYHERTKGFTNGLGELRTSGYIDYPQPGMVELLGYGRGEANVPDAPLTTEALQDMVYRQIGPAKARVLQVLVGRYPDAILRSDLAERLGYHERTKGFTNALGSLRSLGLIDYPQPGSVHALPVLFVEDSRAGVG